MIIDQADVKHEVPVQVNQFQRLVHLKNQSSSNTKILLPFSYEMKQLSAPCLI